MKRILSTLSLSALIFSFTVSPTFAQRSNSVPYLIPGNIDLYLEFNPQQSNPVNELIEKIIEQNKENDSIFDEPGNIIAETIISSPQVIAAVKLQPGEYSSDMVGYFLVESDENNYKNFLTKLRKANHEIENYFDTLLPKTSETEEDQTLTPNSEEIIPNIENYKGYEIEHISHDSITYYKNYILISDEIELIKEFIDFTETGSQDTLINNPEFKKVESKFLQDSFANAYINSTIYDELASEFNSAFGVNNLNNATPLTAIEAAGLSLSNDNDIFQIENTNIINQEFLDKTGITSEDYNFYSRFTKKFNHEDAILFFEEYNITGQLAAIVKAAESNGDIGVNFIFNEISRSIATLTGIETSELGELAKQHMAFAIYDNDSVIPGFTIAFNVEANKDIAEKVANQLMKFVREEARAEITEMTETVNTQRITTLNFKTPMGHQIKFTASIIGNDLIISNDLNLKNHFSENFEIIQASKTSEILNSIAYINPSNAINTLKHNLINMEHISEDYADRIAHIILDPYGPISALATVDTNIVTNSATAKLDLNKLLEYQTINSLFIEAINDRQSQLSETSSITNNDDDISFPSTLFFCDYEKISDDHYTAVNDLVNQSILKGDQNQCLNPQKSVNRAEFITLIDRAFNLPATDQTASFPDVPNNAWYQDALSRAVAAGVVKGNPDGTLRPGNNVELVEALAMINRARDAKIVAPMEMPYIDVNETDWFYQDVVQAFDAEIINFTETLEPGKQITREEAATLIYRAYSY